MVECDAPKFTEARRQAMKYVCDASGGKTWFRIETEAEATAESDVMRHKVAKYFYQEKDKATRSFVPSSRVPFERDIGLAAHVQREMPLFLTLRDGDGAALVTAMLPPGGKDDRTFRSIIVGTQVPPKYGLEAEHLEEVMIDHHRRHAICACLCREVDGGAGAINREHGK